MALMWLMVVMIFEISENYMIFMIVMTVRIFLTFMILMGHDIINHLPQKNIVTIIYVYGNNKVPILVDLVKCLGNFGIVKFKIIISVYELLMPKLKELFSNYDKLPKELIACKRISLIVVTDYGEINENINPPAMLGRTE
jgi:hypothetical protein